MTYQAGDRVRVIEVRPRSRGGADESVVGSVGTVIEYCPDGMYAVSLGPLTVMRFWPQELEPAAGNDATMPQWLADIAADADAHLASLPAWAQPTWYRHNVTEPRERAAWSPTKRAVYDLLTAHPRTTLTHADGSALADAILTAVERRP